MRTKLLLVLLLTTGLLSAQTVDLDLVSDDFESISEIVNAGDDRLFVVEQGGHIRILNADGTVNEADFLDVSSLVSDGGEQGLLGLAFHPEYAANGYFYINYTNLDGDTVVARYTKSAGNDNTADATSAVIMLAVE